MTDRPSTPPIRLIISDVDGTLIGAERDISAGVYDTLMEARLQGVQIALCTGRPMFATRRFVEELQLPGFHIFDAGAIIADPLNGLTLYRHGIEQNLARQLLDRVREARLHVEVYVDDKYYVEALTPQSQVHTDVLEYPPILADLNEIITRRPITKMEIVTLSEAEMALTKAVAQQFAEHIDTGWATAPGTSAGFCNILAKGVSKGEGAARLIEHLGIPSEQVMAIGDGANDEPMLRLVGVPVAMGDAPETLKKAAIWVTTTVLEDGLALAVDRLILSGERNESPNS